MTPIIEQQVRLMHHIEPCLTPEALVMLPPMFPQGVLPTVTSPFGHFKLIVRSKRRFSAEIDSSRGQARYYGALSTTYRRKMTTKST